MEAQKDCWYDPLFVLPDLNTPNPMDQGELNDDDDDDDDLDVFAILEEAAEVLQHVSDDELLKQETVRITKGHESRSGLKGDIFRRSPFRLLLLPRGLGRRRRLQTLQRNLSSNGCKW